MKSPIENREELELSKKLSVEFGETLNVKFESIKLALLIKVLYRFGMVRAPNSFIDSHCHLAEPRLEGQLAQFIQESKSKGIRYFIQGGIGPEDWQRQQDLSNIYPEVIPCFGLHPYWVADHTEAECEAALDILCKKLSKSVALGETGLDFRPHICKGSEARQIEIFENQIQIANHTGKALVLHLVQAHDKALQIFDMQGIPRNGAMVHAFNGSLPQAEEFLKLGFFLSIGGALLKDSNQRLEQAVAGIPLENILVESDSPDQSPPSRQGQLNHPTTILEVAEKIAILKKVSAKEVLDMSRQNLEKLFQWKATTPS